MPDRPNIVFMFSDQHRGDALGCAGHPVVETPHIDRIAERGVQFSHTYTQSPVCVPARCSLFTGAYPHNTHITGNDGWIDPEFGTMFARLQEAGYHTALVGQAHVDWSTDDLRDNEETMHKLGFDYVHETPGPMASVGMESYLTEYWREHDLLETFREDYARRAGPGNDSWPSPMPFEHYFDSYVGREAVEFIQSYDREEPFCLFVGFGGPHGPMDPPEPYASSYSAGDLAGLDEPIPPVKQGESVPDHARRQMDSVGPQADHLEMEQRLKRRAAYYGKISTIDHWVGEIVDIATDLGLRENTTFVYSSDHGEAAGDHGKWSKFTFMEPSIHVPLLISGFGIPSTEPKDDLVELIDIHPTIIEIGGVENPTTFGRSLYPTCQSETGADVRSRDAVHAIISDGGLPGARAMIRTDDHKYAVNETGQGYLLFDLGEDPRERQNRFGDPAYDDIQNRLHDRLLNFVFETTLQLRRQEHRYEPVTGEPGNSNTSDHV